MQIDKEVMAKVVLQTVDTHVKVEVDVLLDSGATGLFIDHVLVKENGVAMRKLEHLITVYNIDGTENKGGRITKEVTLIMSYKNHKE